MRLPRPAMPPHGPRTRDNARNSQCFCLVQASEDDLLQAVIVRGTDAGDGGLDVGVGCVLGFVERLAVVDGVVSVVNGDQVEEQAGGASVEFIKRVQGDEFTLVMRQAFGEFFLRPAGSLFEKAFLLQLPEQASEFFVQKRGRTASRPCSCPRCGIHLPSRTCWPRCAGAGI